MASRCAPDSVDYSVLCSPVDIAVVLDAANPAPCHALADALQCPLVGADNCADYPYVLTYTEHGLAIQQTGARAAGPVLVNFAAGSADHRRRFGGGELIVKAVGGDKTRRPRVLDTTAGLGRDSFVLASAGCSVTLCERSPIVAAVLQDGLSRAAHADNPELVQIVARMQLHRGDALDYMQKAQENPPDVIVIDPMFPVSKKSSLVKKDMRAFHHVVGADSDSEQLLMAALTQAKHRVVVKRPAKAVWLADKKPNFSVAGKAIRFDIYSLKAFGK